MGGHGGRGLIRTKALSVAGLAGSRMMPYLVPWMICVSAMPVALILHLVWGTDTVMIAILASTATLLTGVTHLTWRRRHQHTRAAATLFAAVVLGWIVFAMATDPIAMSMIKAWAVGTVFVSAVWDIRHGSMSPHHDTDKPGQDTDTLYDQVRSLSGARTEKVDTDPGKRVAATIQLKPGEFTVRDVQADKDRIAGLVGMGENEVSVSGVPGRADQVRLAFQKADSQKKSVVWPGPSAPGKSIADAPLVVGRRSGGSPLDVWLVGNSDPDNPRPLPHTLITGVNGSGKTETLMTMIVEMRWRKDVVPVVAGPKGKVIQDFGPILHSLGIVVLGEEDVAQFIRNLPDAIGYRQQVFGELVRSDGTTGYAQWEPELFTLHGFPLVAIDVEEAADFLSESDDEFDQAIRTARSAGIPLIASMQTAIFTNISRKTRGQFTNGLCHGCVEMQDARFSLSPETLDSGADPTKWRNDFPGSLYGELVGTDHALWAEDARAFYISREQKIKELADSKAAGCWAQMDPGTFQYLTRGLSAYRDNQVAIESAPEQEQEQEQPVRAVHQVIDQEGREVDVSVELTPPAHDTRFAPVEPVRVSTEGFRAMIAERIDSLDAQGKEIVGFADLSDLVDLTGRKRSAIYDELSRLVREGRLTQVNGKPPYRIRSRVLNGHR